MMCQVVANLQQSLAVLGTPRTDDLKAGDLTVPRCVVLRVLSCDTGSSTVRATEDDGYGDIAARHVICLAGRVDNLVDGLHSEVEGHELATKDRVSSCVFCAQIGVLTYIGRRPAKAAPIARPAKPISVMGVSITRFSPNLSRRPLVTYMKE